MRKRIRLLLDPEMCEGCPFNKPCMVSLTQTVKKRMVYCTRKDCDNWSYKDTELVEVEIDGKR